MTDALDPAADAPLTYAGALRELEQILAQLERDDVDVSQPTEGLHVSGADESGADNSCANACHG